MNRPDPSIGRVLRPGGDVIGGAFLPAPNLAGGHGLPDRPQVTAVLIKRRPDLLFGKFPDQQEQPGPRRHDEAGGKARADLIGSKAAHSEDQSPCPAHVPVAVCLGWRWKS